MAVDKNVCLDILKKLYSNENYELVDWKLRSFEERVGYHGSHNLLTITVRVLNETKTHRFFVKIANDSQEIYDGYWKNLKCFDKEYHMLEKILVRMEETVGEKLAPKCYVNELNKYVILEDLSESGYKSEKEKSKGFDFVWKTVEKLAVFHAASMILEVKGGKKLQDIFPEINFESIAVRPYEEGYVMKAVCTMVNDLVQSRIDEIPPDMKDKFMDWLIRTEVEQAKPSLKYRNAVCHGDPWYMNFMYKCNGNGQCEDIVMVDFQFSRIAPPALEIQQYLALIFSLDKIRSIKEKITTVYFIKLTKELSKAGIDISTILPREHLKESYDFYQPFGVISNMLYKLIVTMPPNHMQQIDTPGKYVNLMTSGNTKFSRQAFDENEGYRNNMTNAIMDCYKLFLEDENK